MLSPYLWKHRGTGRIKCCTKVGDVVFIQNLKRLGIVLDISSTQLKIKYLDRHLKQYMDWFPKSAVVHLLTGSVFVSQDSPGHQVDEELKVQKGLE